MAGAALLVHQAMTAWLVHPVTVELDSTRHKVRKVRDEQDRARQLRERVDEVESRLRAKEAVAARIRILLLDDREDQLWLLNLQKDLWARYPDVQVTKQQTSMAHPIEPAPRVDVAAELGGLVAGQDAAGVRPGARTSAGRESSLWTVEARLRLTGPYPSVFAAIDAVARQSTVYRVTRLEARHETPLRSGVPRLTAIIGITTAAMSPARADSRQSPGDDTDEGAATGDARR